MAYASHVQITNNLLAIVGSGAYGYSATISTFDPACDGYKGLANGSTSFTATPSSGGQGISQTMSPLTLGDHSPITLDL